MRTRHARMIRRGIYLAHGPLSPEDIESMPNLVRYACFREQIAARHREALAIQESLRINEAFQRIIQDMNGADW